MKYSFTGITKEVDGTTLRQIVTVSDGLIGGWIEKESNLSQKGRCFVFDNATVSGDALVSCNASVSENAVVYGTAILSCRVSISGRAKVYGDCRLAGTTTVSGSSEIYDTAHLSGNVVVYGNTKVHSNAHLCVGRYVTGDIITDSCSRGYCCGWGNRYWYGYRYSGYGYWHDGPCGCNGMCGWYWNDTYGWDGGCGDGWDGGCGGGCGECC